MNKTLQTEVCVIHLRTKILVPFLRAKICYSKFRQVRWVMTPCRAPLVWWSHSSLVGKNAPHVWLLNANKATRKEYLRGH